MRCKGGGGGGRVIRRHHVPLIGTLKINLKKKALRLKMRKLPLTAP